MTNLFVGACLLIGALSSGVPPLPTQSVPNLRKMPENDPTGFDDSLIEFHMQAGLVDRTWILFDSGACANCCPEWFAPDYPTLPLNESAPSLRSLSGKTLDVQGLGRLFSLWQWPFVECSVLCVHWHTVSTGQCRPTVVARLLDCYGRGLHGVD